MVKPELSSLVIQATLTNITKNDSMCNTEFRLLVNDTITLAVKNSPGDMTNVGQQGLVVSLLGALVNSSAGDLNIKVQYRSSCTTVRCSTNN